MSIGALYVQADDDRIYSDPIFTDSPGQWFLCFDEDDPTEFVSFDPNMKEHEAKEFLEQRGFSVDWVKEGERSMRLNPTRKDSWEFEKAQAFWVGLASPPPAVLIVKHFGAFANIESIGGEGTYVTFKNR